MPDWVLTASYSAHMLATVLWIGGIVFQAALLFPVALKPQFVPEFRKPLAMLRSRFQPLAWLSLAVLIGSGLTQMTANANYSGLLAIENRWSVAILLKHMGFAGMVGVMAYQTWVLYPRWSRLELILAHSDQATFDPGLLRRESVLMRVQLLLSILVLILTAIARTS
ncbi:MAG: CopD family protein [Anaerolineales bacterium]|jgi:uncharacterized membrane protein